MSKINSYYETFLREIFYKNKDFADIVIDVYEKDVKQRRYIENVLDDYINGCARYLAYKRLKTWIIEPEIKASKKVAKKSAYLDEEFKEKMR